MTRKRRAPGTACSLGKTCLAVCVVEGRRLCAKHAADVVFASKVRASLGGACWAMNHPKVTCNGALQCCHRISRRYTSLRWSTDNAVPMCAAHHMYYTYKPLEWEDINRRSGVDWDRLRERALNDPPMDPVEYLRSEGVEIAA